MQRSRVELGCPDCGHHRVGVFYEDAVQRFGARLEQGTDALVEALEQLERSNVEREIERFSPALDRNQLTAEDF